MTADEIRAAIAADPALQALAAGGATQALADALSAGRTEVRSRITSARGMAEHMPGGPAAAEIVLMKLEGARDAMLGSADDATKVMGSLLRRQLRFLDGEGLDFGSPALRAMLDQFVLLNILTADEVTGLKAIAQFPAPVPEWDVRCAIYADDGTLLV